MRVNLFAGRCVLAFGLSLLIGRTAHAIVTFDWATVANPGNAADTLVMNKGPAADFTTGYGSVGYTYAISKFDVTNSQYVQFLNAADPNGDNTLKLYDARMSTNALGVAYTGGIDLNLAASPGSKYSVKPGQTNYPATWINWNGGARFVNWLSNGQGSGSTESGVYDMSLTLPLRSPGATIFMPTENEYYKAAYYDPTKNGSGGYWQYGDRSDSAPTSQGPPGVATSANYRSDGGVYWQTGSATFDSSVNYLTEVGAYTSAKSYYGLADVEGLVYNWTEDGRRDLFTGSFPIYRGGSWAYGSTFDGAAYRNIYSFANAASYHWYGLRIASLLPAGVPGDYNGNGVVDAADYVLWRNGGPLANEVDAPGTVNAADYTAWRARYGNISGSGAALEGASVPEPTVIALALGAIGYIAICPRERRLHSR